MQGRGGLRFQHVNRFHDHSSLGRTRPQRKRGVPLLRTEQHIQNARDNRMIPRQKTDALPAKRTTTIRRRRQSLFRQGGNLVMKKITATKIESAIPEIFYVEAEVIERVGDE